MSLYDKEQANCDVENIVFRRCKIGKVKLKHLRPDPVVPMWPSPPNDWWRQPFPMYDPLQDIMIGANSKCSCKPGQACGNAACPHGMTVISTTGWPYPQFAPGNVC